MAKVDAGRERAVVMAVVGRTGNKVGPESKVGPENKVGPGNRMGPNF